MNGIQLRHDTETEDGFTINYDPYRGLSATFPPSPPPKRMMGGKKKHKRHYASGSYDNTIKLDMDDLSDERYSFSTLKGYESTVSSVVWPPTHGYLASGSDDQTVTVRIWKR